jgi:hypothetical protein
MSAFSLLAPFTFGKAACNSVIGPGYASLDTACRKRGPSGDENAGVPVGSFHPFNRVTSIYGTASSATQNFGRILSAKGPRV